MPLRHGLITLSDTEATQVLIDNIDIVFYSSSIIVQNVHSSARVYLGDSTVTTNDYGFVLEPKSNLSLDNVPRYPGLYAISDTNESKIAVLRLSK